MGRLVRPIECQSNCHYSADRLRLGSQPVEANLDYWVSGKAPLSRPKSQTREDRSFYMD